MLSTVIYGLWCIHYKNIVLAITILSTLYSLIIV